MLRFALALTLVSSPALAQVATQSGTDGQNSLGSVPCADVAGAALESCPAELRRRDDGTATLAVLLPSGGVRDIYFENGVPTSSSSTSKISHETPGELLIIFIEPSEVYELPKAALANQ